MDKYNKTKWIANETLVAASNLNKIENQLELLTQDATYQEEVNVRVSNKLDDIVDKQNELNEQINDSKTDYFKNKHFNLEERLNNDFDNVHQRINNSSYLTHKGSNIITANSHYGYTKEISVKGRVLQNLCKYKTVNDFNLPSAPTITSEGNIRIEFDGITKYVFVKNFSMIKPSTKYTIFMNVVDSNLDLSLRNNTIFGGSGVFNHLGNGTFKPETQRFVTTSKNDFTNAKHLIDMYFGGQYTDGFIEFNLIVLEGDYSDVDFNMPYFEGIKSVGESEVTEEGKYPVKIRSCGKNIINLANITKKISGSQDHIGGWPSSYYYKNIDISHINGVHSVSAKNFVNGVSTKCKFILSKEEVIDDYNTHTDIYIQTVGKGTGFEINSDDKIDFTNYKFLHVTPSNASSQDLQSLTISISDIQIEKGVVSTDFEPYQESTQELLLNDPLRSLPNGVCDEITADGTEIRRIKKIIFDGSDDEKWHINITNANTFRFRLRMNTNSNKFFQPAGWCDTLPFYPNNNWRDDKDLIEFDPSYVSIRKSFTTVEEFKDYLKANPATVYYELAEPIITKHNKNMNLKTFNSITHITSTNALPAVIDCKISSNVQEVVSNLIIENESLNKEVLNLNLENEKIKSINATQDELVNTTMLAADEMYCLLEPLLVDTLVDSETVTPLINMYIAMIKRGLKTEDEVPAKYREQVKRKLHQ